MKMIWGVLFGICLMGCVTASEIDYAQFARLEDLIHFETAQIVHAEQIQDRQLPVHYLDRGESYLLSGRFEEARQDFQKGYDLHWAFCDMQCREMLEFRSLLGITLTSAILGDNQQILPMSERLEDLLSKEEDVIGTDREPYGGWCEETARYFGNSMRELIVFVPKIEDKVILRCLVSSMETAALRCCSRRTPWKACIGPLAKKFHLWDERWKSRGLPPALKED